MSNNDKEKKLFSILELKKFDGKDGRPAYVVFRGEVYDVSKSPLWENGNHEGLHTAGLDLTESLLNAPHDDKIFSKFPVVGVLVKEKKFQERFVRRIQKMHLHPITVHFSIAIPILVSLLSAFYILTGENSFEVVSYYLLMLGFLAGIAGGLSGLFSWKVTYEGRMTKMFARKIWFTIILMAVITVSFGWRTLDPNILIAETTLSYIYLTLIASLVPISTILGYYGGKIVYPGLQL